MYIKIDSENSLILCSFRRIIVVCSLLGLMRSPSMSSWLYFHYQTCISACRVGLVSNQNADGYPHIIDATIAQLGISSHAGRYCRPQGSQFGKTINDFSLTAFLTPSGPLKAISLLPFTTPQVCSGEEANWSVKLLMTCDQNVCCLHK